MKIYLASQYARREELAEKAKQVKWQCPQHSVTSRWLEPSNILDSFDESNWHNMQAAAQMDLADIQAARMIILFSEDPNAAIPRGARHWEFGCAFALGKICWLVGPVEIPFHLLRGVSRFSNWETCLEALSRIP